MKGSAHKIVAVATSPVRVRVRVLCPCSNIHAHECNWLNGQLCRFVHGFSVHSTFHGFTLLFLQMNCFFLFCSAGFFWPRPSVDLLAQALVPSLSVCAEHHPTFYWCHYTTAHYQFLSCQAYEGKRVTLYLRWINVLVAFGSWFHADCRRQINNHFSGWPKDGLIHKSPPSQSTFYITLIDFAERPVCVSANLGWGHPM